MKNLYFLLFALTGVSASAQIVNIPDPAFKAALLNYTPAIDTNSDGEIQLAEAQAVSALDLLYQSAVLDFTGIKSFTNLESLKISSSYNVVALDLGGMSNLLHLEAENCNALTNVNLSGLTALIHLDLSRNNLLSAIDLGDLNALKLLELDGCYALTSVSISNLSNLENADFSDCMNLTSLDASGLANLKTLRCRSAMHNTAINVSGCTGLQILDASLCALTALDVAGLVNLQELYCEMNEISTLAIANLTNLQKLNCSNNQLTSLDVANLVNLNYLGCYSNQISSLDVGGLVNLTTLDVRYNLINSLELDNLNLIETLNAGGNQLMTLNLAGVPNLEYLDCHSNLLTALDLSAQQQLLNIDCGQNQIAALEVSPIANIEFLACAGNNLTALDVTMLPNLERLICSGNQLTTIDLSQNGVLTSIEVGGNLFTELDFSHTGTDATELLGSYYSIGNNPNLIHLNLKNGLNFSFGSLMAFDCPNLVYICADEQNIPYILNSISFDELENIQVNSYCSFTPNGNHNTITGIVTLDNDNNGCDAGDSHFSDMKMTLDDGTASGATFTTASGAYTFFTQTGNFTITPQFENPFFTVSPPSATINFTSDNNTQTQNFCLVPNGIHNDLEVALLPIGPARPGFDASYQLTYKNKGNQTLSGTVSLDYNDSVLDFVNSNPIPSDTATGYLQWGFTALQPFESRSVIFMMNLNSPLETPAVEIGAELNFIAAINPIANDETPEDNISKLDQTVVGSFDPNDKTCVEGAAITQQMVGGYLHYVIRFQNSGNFYAENVVVKDVIDPVKFDISSLQLTAASHPHTTRITGNTVEFIFEGINLPAEEDDEPGSHGYVAFKIKTNPNLVLGNSVSNIADIFFDFNAPITTLPAVTTVSSLGVGDFEDVLVSIAPNPVNDVLNVSARDAISSVQIFDLQGRLLHEAAGGTNQAAIDFSRRTSGIYLIKVTTANGVKVAKIIKN